MDQTSCLTLLHNEAHLSLLANDILSNTKRRRAYDSVDPTFDDAIPTLASADNFFEVFAPVFEENARSEVTDVCVCVYVCCSLIGCSDVAAAAGGQRISLFPCWERKGRA